jgi:hypothetical protein
MKRYVSHFLLLPPYGYLKKCVVETEHEFVVRLFPFNEEIESTEWLSGLIVLFPKHNILDHLFREKVPFLEKIPLEFSEGHIPLLFFHAYLFSPFDFTLMQPVCGTQRKQLP